MKSAVRLASLRVMRVAVIRTAVAKGLRMLATRIAVPNVDTTSDFAHTNDHDRWVSQVPAEPPAHGGAHVRAPPPTKRGPRRMPGTD